MFASRDPFEGVAERAMSLNGYSWVEGNVPNVVDPSGMIGRGDPYSCLCGWLDWGHISRFDEFGFAIVDDVAFVIGASIPQEWSETDLDKISSNMYEVE